MYLKVFMLGVIKDKTLFTSIFMYLISLLLLKQNYERLLYQINENTIAQYLSESSIELAKSPALSSTI